MAKQTEYNAGIYLRLNQENLLEGDSLSIENQKLILTKFVVDKGWTLYDTYVDDGISGTSFDRPGVQRMLDDAKNGKNQSDYPKRPLTFRKKLHRSRQICGLYFSVLQHQIYRSERPCRYSGKEHFCNGHDAHCKSCECAIWTKFKITLY